MKKLLLCSLGLLLSASVTAQSATGCYTRLESYNIHEISNSNNNDYDFVYFNFFELSESTTYDKIGIYVTSEMLSVHPDFKCRLLLYKGTLSSISELLLNEEVETTEEGYLESALGDFVLEPGQYWVGAISRNSYHFPARYHAVTGARYLYLNNTAVLSEGFDFSALNTQVVLSYGSGYCMGTYMRRGTVTDLDSVVCSRTITHDDVVMSSDFDFYVQGEASACDLTHYSVKFKGEFTDHSMITCGSYVWPLNGETYTASGVYEYVTGTNSYGCPIMEVLDLTIGEPINNSITISAADSTMFEVADVPGFTYQWFLCGEGFNSIEGATSASYVPTMTGAYTVLIDNGICSSMSECVRMDYLSTIDVFQNSLTVSPNPTKGIVTLSLAGSVELSSIELIDINGKVLQSTGATTLTTMNYAIDQQTGIYFLKLVAKDGAETVIRLIKE